MRSEIPGLGSRREAREEALAILYQAELTGDPVAEILAARQVPLSSYAVEIVEQVDAGRDDLDALLGRHLENWRVERMPLVDRVIARIAAWELGDRSDVPTGVVLSEAIAIATQYCAEQSPRFLNGVLGSVAGEVRG